MDLYIIADKGRRATVYGIGTYLGMLSASLQLQPSNIRLHLIELNSDSGTLTISNREGVEYWSVPAPRVHSTDWEKDRKLYLENVVCLLKLHIKESDELVFHLNYMESQPLADALRSSFSCKIVIAVHYLTWQFNLMGNKTRMKQLLAANEEEITDPLEKEAYTSFHTEKKLFETVDAVICLALDTARIVEEWYEIDPSAIAVVKNGLKDEPEQQSKDQLRSKYRIPPDAPVVVFAGRVDPIKGISHILQAADKVLEKLPECHFLIAGSGEYDTYLGEYPYRLLNIHFTGLVKKQTLYEFYALADIGIMGSFHEQCSYVAIEMMMHGLPLIGTTSTGLAEMIEEGRSGYRIPVKETLEGVDMDVELMAKQVICLLEKPDFRVSMGKCGRERYQDHYALPHMGKNMLEFYDRL